MTIHTSPVTGFRPVSAATVSDQAEYESTQHVRVKALHAAWNLDSNRRRTWNDYDGYFQYY